MMRRVVQALLALLLAAGTVRADDTVLLVHPGAARAVLLDPDVRKFLHTDLWSRKPFLISDHLLVAKESDLDLPFQVRIVSSKDPSLKQAFQFTGARAGPDNTVLVTFEFPPEGMLGSAQLRSQKGTWVVVEREVREN